MTGADRRHRSVRRASVRRDNGGLPYGEPRAGRARGSSVDGATPRTRPRRSAHVGDLCIVGLTQAVSKLRVVSIASSCYGSPPCAGAAFRPTDAAELGQRLTHEVEGACEGLAAGAPVAGFPERRGRLGDDTLPSWVRSRSRPRPPRPRRPRRLRPRVSRRLGLGVTGRLALRARVVPVATAAAAAQSHWPLSAS